MGGHCLITGYYLKVGREPTKRRETFYWRKTP
jgi:hypothetical protein